MKCPICGSKAKELPRSSPDVYSIRCPADGDYDITVDAWQLLEDLHPTDRQLTLCKAIKAARPGERPRIDRTLFKQYTRPVMVAAGSG